MSSDSEPRAKRRKIDFSEEIKVIVGKNEKRYTVHKDVITSKSKFFRAACNGQFKEAKEKKVRLPKVKSAVFERYLQWAYTGEVVVMCDGDQEQPCEGAQVPDLIKLYALADQICDIRLCNATVTNIIDVAERTYCLPYLYAVKLAYRLTARGSNLRKLMADFYNRYEEIEWLNENRDELPRDFLIDVVARVKKPKGGLDCDKKCRYHEHNDEVPRCSKETDESDGEDD